MGGGGGELGGVDVYEVALGVPLQNKQLITPSRVKGGGKRVRVCCCAISYATP